MKSLWESKRDRKIELDNEEYMRWIADMLRQVRQWTNEEVRAALEGEE